MFLRCGDDVKRRDFLKASALALVPVAIITSPITGKPVLSVLGIATCPLCGSKATLITFPAMARRRIRCTNPKCECEKRDLGDGGTGQQALANFIAQWNRRVL
jgi:hypothetical protein